MRRFLIFSSCLALFLAACDQTDEILPASADNVSLAADAQVGVTFSNGKRMAVSPASATTAGDTPHQQGYFTPHLVDFGIM